MNEGIRVDFSDNEIEVSRDGKGDPRFAGSRARMTPKGRAWLHESVAHGGPTVR